MLVGWSLVAVVLTCVVMQTKKSPRSTIRVKASPWRKGIGTRVLGLYNRAHLLDHLLHWGHGDNAVFPGVWDGFACSCHFWSLESGIVSGVNVPWFDWFHLHRYLKLLSLLLHLAVGFPMFSASQLPTALHHLCIVKALMKGKGFSFTGLIGDKWWAEVLTCRDPGRQFSEYVLDHPTKQMISKSKFGDVLAIWYQNSCKTYLLRGSV